MKRKTYLQRGLNGLIILLPMPRFRCFETTPFGVTTVFVKNPTPDAVAGVELASGKLSPKAACTFSIFINLGLSQVELLKICVSNAFSQCVIVFLKLDL